ncbi:putative periplasmic metal-binding protein [Lentibacillus sp. JNUCC-1]|uniref:metal ABC transporter solute-binding protein, Zn/Mn family n=1 Tax=Lentibacillus sp. JNUCC-1 TaxID=2654513 RepID=UPI0012E92536|nr:zinc ABC transporter substrate-binding protein [Lentibacillus sp. JNUCC-1]MUV39124.1 putative periplasmic metal-binding protein [Lentibacillus sp. JNUCC-1]
MKKLLLVAAMAVMLLLAACGGEKDASGDDGKDKLKVVTSFTIIADLARQIGGDHVDIHNLVPTGTDPHEYEPLPEDNKKATDADVLFYNGLNLEGGEHGWFFKMIDSIGQNEDKVYSLTEEVDPMYIGGGEHEEEINPHAFIDPEVGIKMSEAMIQALGEVDPDRKDFYEKQGEEYINRLKEIDQKYEERINDIPEDKRILVTSERAFQYMADHYGLEEAFIWEIDTEENGSPEQIKNLVSYIKDSEVPVLFVESNVDTRPMETVSQESGVPIFEEPIYSDEIGEPGEKVDTYVKYLNYNIKIIHDGLSQ